MSRSVNNPRKSANRIDYLRDFLNESREIRDTNLTSTPTLGVALAKGWVYGQSSLHVHTRVRILGESIADDFCWLFQRKRQSPQIPSKFFNQDGIGVPRDNFTSPFNHQHIDLQGSVLIHVGKSFDNLDRATLDRNAIVWLRRLNDCPRVPIDLYPIKNTTLLLTLSGLDFIKKPLLAIINRKLVPPTWFMSVSKNELPKEMIKGRSEIMNDITSDNREPCIRLRYRISFHYVPTTLTPYIKITAIGVLFAPDTKLRFESAMVLFGPPEFSPNASEVSNMSGRTV